MGISDVDLGQFLKCVCNYNCIKYYTYISHLQQLKYGNWQVEERVSWSLRKPSILRNWNLLVSVTPLLLKSGEL